MKGEMQVATWEFAAGSFPNIFAKLFCLPLVAMGAILIPRKILSAYRQGRRSKSLFLLNLDSDVINMPLEKLKALTANHTNEVSLLRDVLGYTALVGASLLMCLLPIVSGVFVFLQVMG